MASNHEDCDVFDSWENIEDTDLLEKKLNEILPQNERTMDTKSCNKTPVNVILLGEDALRSQYVPPEPTVKILKRPPNGATTVNGKPKIFLKPLKQREQEYAEARLRILGEAHGSEKEDRVCSIQNKIQQNTRNDSTNVIRMPKGPDGSKGFNIRR